MTKFPNINPKSIPTFPTKYTSKEWQCAITSNFAGSVPHIPYNMFTIPDNPEYLQKNQYRQTSLYRHIQEIGSETKIISFRKHKMPLWHKFN